AVGLGRGLADGAPVALLMTLHEAVHALAVRGAADALALALPRTTAAAGLFDAARVAPLPLREQRPRSRAARGEDHREERRPTQAHESRMAPIGACDHEMMYRLVEWGRHDRRLDRRRLRRQRSVLAGPCGGARARFARRLAARRGLRSHARRRCR